MVRGWQEVGGGAGRQWQRQPGQGRDRGVDGGSGVRSKVDGLSVSSSGRSSGESTGAGGTR